jgi:HEPN domain-containing protein
VTDRIEEARRWLRQSHDDLAAARSLRSSSYFAQACFLAQQAAEKALKGWLYRAGAEVVLGHSVARLCEEVAVMHPDLEEKCRRWAALDQYYVPTRYPDALPGGTPSEIYGDDQARQAIATAEEVLTEVATAFP